MNRLLMSNRLWYWGITNLGQGPDYVFWATFAPSDAAQLAALVERHRPSRFMRDAANPGTIRCLDADAYTKLQAMQRGKDERIWFAATIEVRGHELLVYHQMGGQDYHDTPLIKAVTQAPELTLQQWRVSYSGDGYAAGDAARGHDAKSLIAYLSGDWPS